ncbi:hypothetical protein AALA00_11235 [Lachnospiraceae bacterium 46-15]
MKTIYIDPACVKKIRKELKVMGIVTPKMYPELNKVFLSKEE